jgi:lipoyl-dependent peroxiredoxin
MAKVVYTAEARVAGGRANGRGRTADGALHVELAVNGVPLQD